ncbi:hypothetical protein G6F65_021003 [Rhizopus arrhizus]|nr:hypothetical protein G6F65_021003 [Rhizopus arrhizus]
METGARIRADGLAQHRRGGDVADLRIHARIGQRVGFHDVQQVDPRDGLRAAAIQRQRALLQQFAGQPLAQESGAAGLGPAQPGGRAGIGAVFAADPAGVAQRVDPLEQ